MAFPNARTAFSNIQMRHAKHNERMVTEAGDTEYSAGQRALEAARDNIRGDGTHAMICYQYGSRRQGYQYA